MICPKCKRQISYIRIKTGEAVCQKCGVVLPKEEVEKQSKEEQI